MAYTDVSREQATELLNAAGLTGLESISPLAGGWANSNYLLTLEDETKLVLKVWDERPPSDIEPMIEHTVWLADNGIPTPVPLPFEKGSRMVVKNGAAWILMPYIEEGWLPCDPTSLAALGKVQARLHEIPHPPKIQSSYSMGFDHWRLMIEVAKKQDEITDFIELLTHEVTDLQSKIPEHLPCGVIHGDLFPDNVLGANGEVSAILDFEEICLGPKAFDLVMSFVGFGWHEGEPVASRWTALLAGYESERALEEREREALSDLHRYATLSIAAWRYWKFVMTMPPNEHTARYLEMVERLDKPLPF
uniref:Putative homoserine kinase type II (ThrB2) n=1 Tax=uncultured marine group II/III euryarchaeote KM3_115_D04 TaxID=1457855 RepID=A0A075G7U8_9EURY|nr:putative homoserine kinase type II (thrB2) [uncultured marine group II/III euryarchaeote KM3_115_D04]